MTSQETDGINSELETYIMFVSLSAVVQKYCRLLLLDYQRTDRLFRPIFICDLHISTKCLWNKCVKSKSIGFCMNLS